MSADIDKACATIDRAIAELDDLHAQVAAKDALITNLTAALRKALVYAANWYDEFGEPEARVTADECRAALRRAAEAEETK